MADEGLTEKLSQLERRLEQLERLLGVSGWQPAPGFDPIKFQRVFRSYFSRLGIVFGLLLVAFVLVAFALQRTLGPVSESRLFGLPLFAEGGRDAQYPVRALGMPVAIFALHGIGLVSFGGGAVGIVAVGGFAVGVFAVGGGAFGLISFGGGSVGVIAVGGGAAGYIAIGGGAYGVYVLAGEGKGRYVFDRRRQDRPAVQLFCQYLPRLQQAFTEGPTWMNDQSMGPAGWW